MQTQHSCRSHHSLRQQENASLIDLFSVKVLLMCDRSTGKYSRKRLIRILLTFGQCPNVIAVLFKWLGSICSDHTQAGNILALDTVSLYAVITHRQAIVWHWILSVTLIIHRNILRKINRSYRSLLQLLSVPIAVIML